MKPTPAQRKVLTEIAGGDKLVVLFHPNRPDEIRLLHSRRHLSSLEFGLLLETGWIQLRADQPPSDVYRTYTITEAGRKALEEA